MIRRKSDEPQVSPRAQEGEGLKTSRSYIRAAIKAAAHPYRASILKSLKEGDKSTVELEQVTGEARYNLYHHLNALEQVGLVGWTMKDNKTKLYHLKTPTAPEVAVIILSEDDIKAKREKFKKVIDALSEVEGEAIPNPEKITSAEICLYYEPAHALQKGMTSMPAKRVLLVDGYNVINQIPELEVSLDGSERELEKARNRLALQISTWSQTHPGFECVIVFDGDPQYAGSRDQNLAGIRCIFSRTSHGGDAEIIRFVRDFKGRKSDITVVSDDNNVRNNCRAHGASVQPSSYIMIMAPRPMHGGREAAGDDRGIDPRAVAAINKELKKKFGL